MKINPIKLIGNWTEGYALDYHTEKSIFLGYDENGQSHFDTIRSEIGEIIFQIKYRNDISKIDELAKEVANFIKNNWKIEIYGIIAVPPSKSRFNQPVFLLTERIANYLEKPYSVDFFRKNSDIQIKNLSFEEKNKLDTSNLIIKQGHLKQKNSNILLIDDLYSSGFIIKAVVDSLKKDINIGNIYVLTMTKTKGR